MLREGVPKSNGIWGKRMQVVVTSGVRDKVRRGMLLSSDCLKELYIYVQVYPLGHLIFCIKCIVFHLFYGLLGISSLKTGAY